MKRLILFLITVFFVNIFVFFYPAMIGFAFFIDFMTIMIVFVGVLFFPKTWYKLL
ncbi:UNVERIFIED_ORG: hypothetical protein C7429_102612 [Pantoea allii]|jgi:hypothetical protein